MARTPSNMIPLGTKAPEFTLPDAVSGKTISLADLKSDVGLVVMFICNHCPFVKHINSELVALGKMYAAEGVSFVAINSNDAENFPEDSPQLMAETARQLGYPFSYLYDETQEIAKAYNAACTPDFFVFDENLSLVYRGQLDDSRPGSDIPVSGQDLRCVLDALTAGKPIDADQKASMGCNIKWKA